MASRVEITFDCGLFELALAKYEKPIIINGVERLYTLREMKPLGRPAYLSLIVKNVEKSRLISYKFFNYSERSNSFDDSVIMSIDEQFARAVGRYNEFVFHKDLVWVKSIHSIVPDTSPYSDEAWKTMSESQYVHIRALDCNADFDINQTIDPDIQSMLPELRKHRENFISKINNLTKLNLVENPVV